MKTRTSLKRIANAADNEPTERMIARGAGVLAEGREEVDSWSLARSIYIAMREVADQEAHD